MIENKLKRNEGINTIQNVPPPPPPRHPKSKSKGNLQGGRMVKNKLIYQKIVEINKSIGAILKTGTNLKQGWKFRGIDQVYNSLHSLLSDNDVFTTSEIIEQSVEFKTNDKGSIIVYRFAKVKYYFHTIDGSFISTEVLAESMDYGDKASGKLMSYAHKYAFFQIFTIPTEELQDPDNDSFEDVKPVKENKEEKKTIIHNETDTFKAIVAFVNKNQGNLPENMKGSDIIMKAKKMTPEEQVAFLNDLEGNNG